MNKWVRKKSRKTSTKWPTKVGRTKVKISSDYATYRAEFVKMISEFEPTFDGNIAYMKSVKHRIEISSCHSYLFSSKAYHACSEAGVQRARIRKDDWNEGSKNGTNQVRITDHLCPKKYHTIHFCVEYPRLNTVTDLEAYPILYID